MFPCFVLTVNFSMNNCSASIEILTGSNYGKWKQDLEFSLGIADLDLSLREDKPVITDESTPEQKELLAKWERSDRLSLMAIKRTVSEHLLSGLPETGTAKEFLTALGGRYQISGNAESGCLMKQLTDMRYDNVGGVREFIMKMVHIQTKLKSHSIELNEKFIVEHALNCLPADFTQIKTAHNTIGESWSVNDLITKCVAEEEKLKKEKSEIALLTVHGKPYSGKGKWKNKKGTSNSSHNYGSSGKPGKSQYHHVGGPKPTGFKKNIWCFWCKEKGHKKANCAKFKAWLENKQKSEGKNLAFVSSELAFVCYESNLVDVPIDSWWIDSGTTTHIAVTL